MMPIAKMPLDDVITTGSAVTECAKVPRKAGVAGMDVPGVARVVTPYGVAV